jgi:hypothetical protein
MQLQVPFVQLPLRFDAQQLVAEVEAIERTAWREHPQKYPGNYALPLIASEGDPDSDAIWGPMRPTEYLRRCPYLQHVLARLGAVWGRTRLMKLAPGAEVTPHADINYYWRDRVRVHVPVLTSARVQFVCGEAEVNMAAGECWIFDTWRPHRVLNPTPDDRIHLVADTVGGDAFWAMVELGRSPQRGVPHGWQAEEFLYDAANTTAPKLVFESNNVPQVMSPWELRDHIQFILDNVETGSDRAAVQRHASRFIFAWRAIWARYGDVREGWPLYRQALDAFIAQIEPQATPLQLTNGMRLMATLRAMVLGVALADRREHAGEVRASPPMTAMQPR